jgi:hypothetical protein
MMAVATSETTEMKAAVTAAVMMAMVTAAKITVAAMMAIATAMAAVTELATVMTAMATVTAVATLTNQLKGGGDSGADEGPIDSGRGPFLHKPVVETDNHQYYLCSFSNTYTAAEMTRF